jgi:hypothetical protein
MRKLLLLGLCLALTLQGVVQARVVEKPCPVQRLRHAQSAHAPSTAHDCCNDAGTAAKTGKVCKTGQACATTGAWLISTRYSCSLLPAALPLLSSPEPFALRIDPGGRWRPPALS